MRPRRRVTKAQREADIESSDNNDPYGAVSLPPCRPQDHKTRKNCAKNPNCLYGLGECNIGIWKKLTKKKERERKDEEYPGNLIRDYNTPVGLRNLGATCYINALMQCLFMNLDFRAAVFSWRAHGHPPPEIEDTSAASSARSESKFDSDTHEETVSTPAVPSNLAVMAELQKIFVRMQQGMAKTCDLHNMIRLLGISTSIQQDAQEFNKLFLSHLERTLSTNSDPLVKELPFMFRGTQTYSTTCSHCETVSERSTDFYELELQVMGKTSVLGCLDELSESEELTAGNQYMCEACGCKRDASREFRVSSPPDVLNLQLFRFFYDTAKGDKRKLKDAILIPREIDLTELMHSEWYGPGKTNTGEDRTADSQQVIYELRAVLDHRGATAHAGHYTADVRDPASSAWWHFNDEMVEKFESEIHPEGFESLREYGAFDRVGDGDGNNSSKWFVGYGAADAAAKSIIAAEKKADADKKRKRTTRIHKVDERMVEEEEEAQIQKVLAESEKEFLALAKGDPEKEKHLKAQMKNGGIGGIPQEVFEQQQKIVMNKKRDGSSVEIVSNDETNINRTVGRNGSIDDNDNDDVMEVDAPVSVSKEAKLAKTIGSQFAYMLVYQRRNVSSNSVAHAATIRANDEANEPKRKKRKLGAASRNGLTPSVGETSTASDIPGVISSDGFVREPRAKTERGVGKKDKLEGKEANGLLADVPADVEDAVVEEGDALLLLRKEYQNEKARVQKEIEIRKAIYEELFLGKIRKEVNGSAVVDGIETNSVVDVDDSDDDDDADDDDVGRPYVIDEDSAYFWIETEWLRAWVCGQLPAKGQGSYNPFHKTNASSPPSLSVDATRASNLVVDVDAEDNEAAKIVTQALFSVPLDMSAWVCEHGREAGINSFNPSALGSLKRVSAKVWLHFMGKYGAKGNEAIGGDFRCKACVAGTDALLVRLTTRSEEADSIKRGSSSAVSKSLLRELEERDADVGNVNGSINGSIEIDGGNNEELVSELKRAASPMLYTQRVTQQESGIVWVSLKWIKSWGEHCNELKRLVAKVEKGDTTAAVGDTGISKYFNRTNNSNGTADDAVVLDSDNEDEKKSPALSNMSASHTPQDVNADLFCSHGNLALEEACIGRRAVTISTWEEIIKVEHGRFCTSVQIDVKKPECEQCTAVRDVHETATANSKALQDALKRKSGCAPLPAFQASIRPAIETNVTTSQAAKQIKLTDFTATRVNGIVADDVHDSVVTQSVSDTDGPELSVNSNATEGDSAEYVGFSTFYLVPHGWMRRWREVVNKPGSVEPEPVGVATKERLICEHGLLSVHPRVLYKLSDTSLEAESMELLRGSMSGIVLDPHDDAYYDSDVDDAVDNNMCEVVCKETWEALNSINKPSSEMEVDVARVEVRHSTSTSTSKPITDPVTVTGRELSWMPDLCEMCVSAQRDTRNKARQVFDNKNIIIKKIILGAATTTPAPVPKTTTRRSKRRSAKDKTESLLRVNSGITIDGIRMYMLQEGVVSDKVSPGAIRLFHKGEELVEQEFTLEMCGVRAGDVIRFDLEGTGGGDGVDAGYMEDEGYQWALASSKGDKAPETGFSGTGLLT